MVALDSDTFPFEAVRDLLGILRALYAAHKARGAGARRLGEISALAVELRRATALARAHAPHTEEHRAAWRMAERATLGLSDLADVTTPLEPTLMAAGERIRSHHASGASPPKAAGGAVAPASRGGPRPPRKGTRGPAREAARRARLTRS